METVEITPEQSKAVLQAHRDVTDALTAYAYKKRDLGVMLSVLLAGKDFGNVELENNTLFVEEPPEKPDGS